MEMENSVSSLMGQAKSASQQVDINGSSEEGRDLLAGRAAEYSDGKIAKFH